jgi:hypothetical protein
MVGYGGANEESHRLQRWFPAPLDQALISAPHSATTGLMPQYVHREKCCLVFDSVYH